MDLLIVDDEKLARDRLVRMLGDQDVYHVVAQADNSMNAYESLMKYDPDIILLDINMPGESGIQLANRICELEDPPAIIFCTAYDQHALEAFQVHAKDYLLKPVKKQKLLASLDQVSSLNKAQKARLEAAKDPSDSRKHISAKTRRGVELVELDKVIYFAADQKYVTVFHDDGDTLIDDTLKELEQEFGSRFVRVHRNALVAVDRIEAMTKNSEGQFVLRLTGCDQHPIVSRRHVSGIKNLMGNL